MRSLAVYSCPLCCVGMVWIIACAVLAARVVLFLSVVCYMRRRHKYAMRARLGTDVSVMSQLTQFTPQDENRSCEYYVTSYKNTTPPTPPRATLRMGITPMICCNI